MEGPPIRTVVCGQLPMQIPGELERAGFGQPAVQGIVRLLMQPFGWSCKKASGQRPTLRPLGSAATQKGLTMREASGAACLVALSWLLHYVPSRVAVASPTGGAGPCNAAPLLLVC